MLCYCAFLGRMIIKSFIPQQASGFSGTATIGPECYGQMFVDIFISLFYLWSEEVRAYYPDPALNKLAARAIPEIFVFTFKSLAGTSPSCLYYSLSKYSPTRSLCSSDQCVPLVWRTPHAARSSLTTLPESASSQVRTTQVNQLLINAGESKALLVDCHRLRH